MNKPVVCYGGSVSDNAPSDACPFPPLPLRVVSTYKVEATVASSELLEGRERDTMALVSSNTSLLSLLLLFLMLLHQGLQTPVPPSVSASGKASKLNCNIIVKEILSSIEVSIWVRLAWCRLVPKGASGWLQ